MPRIGEAQRAGHPLAQANGLGKGYEATSSLKGCDRWMDLRVAAPGMDFTAVNAWMGVIFYFAMPQSLSRILIHLVFSTKHREGGLTPAIQSELHPYLAGTLDNIDCPSVQVGGIKDHVHFLFGLSRTRTIANVVETVKTSSSKWLKTKGGPWAEFHWQGGYGAFSVSQSDADTVAVYIRDQARHHEK